MKYSEFVKLIRESAKAVKEIKTTLHGSTDRISESIKSDIKYPALWFSFPDVEDNDLNTSVEEIWSFAISVFENNENANFENLEKIHDRTLELLRKVVSELRKNIFKGNYDIGENAKYNVIFPKTTDNIQGWQVEFEIKSERCLE